MATKKEDQKLEEKFKSLPIIGDQPKSPEEENFLRELCDFEFLNTQEPGLSVSFDYGSSKHHQKFIFEHGQKYRVPRFIARHIETRGTPIYTWKPDGSGRMMKEKKGYSPRFRMAQSYN